MLTPINPIPPVKMPRWFINMVVVTMTGAAIILILGGTNAIANLVGR